MSLLWMDSFDNYEHLNLKYDVWENNAGNNTQYTLVSGIGRRGNYGLRVYSHDKNSFDSLGLGRSIPETNDVIIGFAFNPRHTDSGYLDLELINGETVQSKIKYRSEEISFTTPDDTILATHSNFDVFGRKLITLQEWNWAEVYVSFGGPASGTVTIRTNEYTSYTNTGLQTAVSGTSIDRIRFDLNPSVTLNAEFMYIDDFVICNTSGTTNNSFTDNVYIDVMYPNASGTYSDFTLSSGTASGTAHYTLVDEKQVNDDTIYYEEYQISSGGDDGSITSDTNIYATEEWMYKIHENEITRSWFRFNNVSIPKNAIIVRAELYYTYHSNYSSCEKSLQGSFHKVPNSPPINYTSVDDLINRTDNESTLTVTEAHDLSPDVTEAFQELVNQDDWQEENTSVTYMTYCGDYGQADWYRIRTYEWDEASGFVDNDRPKLQIDWKYPHNEDGYVTTTATGITDTYKYDTSTLSSGTILGIQHNLISGMTDNSPYFIRMYNTEKLIVSGTEYDNTFTRLPGRIGQLAYNIGYNIHEINPVTSGTWVITDLAALELGTTTISGYSGSTA
jgi:hypothetical protein